MLIYVLRVDNDKKGVYLVANIDKKAINPWKRCNQLL